MKILDPAWGRVDLDRPENDVYMALFEILGGILA
jgi:hypothetical protein